MEMTNASSEGRYKPMALEMWGIHERHQDCSEVRGPPRSVVSGGGFCQERSAQRQCCSETHHGTTNKPASLTVGTPRLSKAAHPCMPPYAPSSSKERNESKSKQSPSSSRESLPRKIGKVFPTNDALIQLASSVASDRESVSKAKVIKQAKIKAAVQAEIEKESKKRTVASARLREAKDKISRGSRENQKARRRKMAPNSTPPPSGKKRVSFS
ncbi:hypothetical protein M407DRAFT_210252 [Tulasnella calospora MUT 4182]|uniref:Uncharacterized protein n=1 Tax=Tulasnella calospora MUT 4182 TaxID=1051891 RepID=A0A0C3QNK4_9AGAM|nr:hypothetical protein M407DRAFT_210252 [Tulasnella calospora MUT 4182]